MENEINRLETVIIKARVFRQVKRLCVAGCKNWKRTYLRQTHFKRN